MREIFCRAGNWQDDINSKLRGFGISLNLFSIKWIGIFYLTVELFIGRKSLYIYMGWKAFVWGETAQSSCTRNPVMPGSRIFKGVLSGRNEYSIYKLKITL